MSRLETILEDMRAAAASNDTEQAHSDADYLLIRTIQVLGGNAGEKELANQILDVYHGMKKWYS